MAEYTYTISTDIESGKADASQLDSEIKNSFATTFQYLSIKSGGVVCFFDSDLSVGDKTSLDEIIRKHSGDGLPKIRITLLAKDEFKNKPYPYIIYKKEMAFGVGLKAKFSYSKEGFVTTEYFQEYNADTDTFSLPVLRVEEVYKLFDDKDFESGKTVKSRVKSWFYAYEDGTYEIEASRVVPKAYTSTGQRLKEGNRRRGNIVSELSKQLVAILMVTGIAASQAEAEALIGAFIVINDTPLSIYQKYALETIFTVIETDITFTWMNQVIPDVDIPNVDRNTAAGLTVRAYCIERLKGEI